MTVVDANVWVSSFISQDVHHSISLRWLEQCMAREDELVVPTLVLAEVAGAVARRTGVTQLGRQAARQIGCVPKLRVIGLSVHLGEDAAGIAADLRVRGADAVYVAVARTLGLPLVTWDQEVQERVVSLVAVWQPYLQDMEDEDSEGEEEGGDTRQEID